MSKGKSFGKSMTWEQHLENYSNKDELKIFKRLFEVSKMMQSGETDQAISILVKEFGSVEDAIDLLEALKKKVFIGWVPEI